MADSSNPDVLYDAIVVGSGPAGNSAAYFLGQAGLRVLVLEKDRLPRYKACGGGLSTRFLREQFPFSFENLVIEKAAAISYIYHDHVSTIPLATDTVGMVMREDLDAYLLRQTRAEVIEGAAVSQVSEKTDRVEVETKDGRCFSARYLIGADGANSVVAHKIGLRRRRTLAAAIEAEVPISPEISRRFDHRMIFIFGEIHYGYLWIFSKAEHLSVGIGALHPTRPVVLQEVLKKVMARYGISLENVPLHGHPIPIFTHHERISSARTLLVGDAAGLADPLSGEGIRFAIKSGRLAAESILRGHPERYAKDLARAIGLNHTLTLLVSISFYYLQSAFVLLGTPNPFSTQAIVKMLDDRMTATEFILSGLLTLPVFIVTELAARLLHRLRYDRLANRLRASVYPRDVKGSYRTADLGLSS